MLTIIFPLLSCRHNTFAENGVSVPGLAAVEKAASM